MIGTRLGDYVVIRELGAGGMGCVFVGEHTTLGRKVAIKLLTDPYADHTLVRRFFNEARAAVRIGHPGIIDIFHYGITDHGHGYIVMELLGGESLAARLRRMGRLPIPVAVALCRQIASALAAAHRADIVHRDLKPDNVFIVPDADVAGGERIKLLDFGIAKLGEGSLARDATRRNAVFGTPAYMAPEQCRSSTDVDGRSDLYSLGCMLFEMLFGRPPFEAQSHVELIQKQLMAPPPTVRSQLPKLPPALATLIERLLMKPREFRPASADEVVATLAGLTLRKRSRAPVAAVLVVGGLGALMAGLWAARPDAGAAADSARVQAVASHATATAPALQAAARPAPAPPAPAPPAPSVQPPQLPPTPTATAAPAPPTVAPAPAPPAPAPKRERKPREPAKAAAPLPPPAPVETFTAEELRELARDAENAYKNGEVARALAICERVLAHDRGSILAATVCAMAACRLGDGETAVRYLPLVPEARRDLIQQRCPAASAAAPEFSARE